MGCYTIHNSNDELHAIEGDTITIQFRNNDKSYTGEYNTYGGLEDKPDGWGVFALAVALEEGVDLDSIKPEEWYAYHSKGCSLSFEKDDNGEYINAKYYPKHPNEGLVHKHLIISGGTGDPEVCGDRCQSIWHWDQDAD